MFPFQFKTNSLSILRKNCSQGNRTGGKNPQPWLLPSPSQTPLKRKSSQSSPAGYQQVTTEEIKSAPPFHPQKVLWLRWSSRRNRSRYTPSLLLLLLLSRFSRVRLCATPQTAAHQAPPSLGFSRQEHCLPASHKASFQPQTLKNVFPIDLNITNSPLSHHSCIWWISLEPQGIISTAA